MAFVCLLEIQLHFPESGSLKGKRREIQSLKAQLQRRFGASVAETAHQETWQRATVSAALVGGEAGSVSRVADGVERFVRGQFPDGVRVDRGLMSADELLS